MALRVGKSCEASIVIDAPVEAVWALVSDVTRTGEWSVECRGADWLDGASGAVKGARFRGRNRRNATRWSRICEVLEVDAAQRLSWRTLPTRLLPDSTRWEFELAPAEAGTRLTERMQVLQIPGLYDRLFAAMLPAHRDRTADLEADLGRIKSRLEASANTAV
ncbi:MAG TPA: SRPBCC family protein [Mycobacteriales bacterium]|nr:SRPBCC family protein [Mycobacteriales bacterium]